MLPRNEARRVKKNAVTVCASEKTFARIAWVAIDELMKRVCHLTQVNVIASCNEFQLRFNNFFS